MKKDSLLRTVKVPSGHSGKWRVEKFTITPKGAKRFNLRAAIRGIGGRDVVPGVFTRLVYDNDTIMSDTPAEQRDHEEFVRNARGHVLINGLGLGMCVAAVLRKKEVETITVIEKSPDVYKLVSPSYVDPRVDIILANALEWTPPRGTRYGAVWHDIWPAICADNLDDMRLLHKRYGRRSAWQGSWCRCECERANRQGW